MFAKSWRIGLLAGAAVVAATAAAYSYSVASWGVVTNSPAPGNLEGVAKNGVVITNGTLKLGVNQWGCLNVQDPSAAASLTQYSKAYTDVTSTHRVWDGSPWVGLRYLKPAVAPAEIEY